MPIPIVTVDKYGIGSIVAVSASTRRRQGQRHRRSRTERMVRMISITAGAPGGQTHCTDRFG